ncbi:hypothetical protein [Myxococcus qinghaiensis]|uniref:hypothetical protein n=1 Tax=Myxococcus qinghaiensis TaxID=2906758 RepID=UPI0020A6E4D4|nr:hypothetical protein [Myxococcus qinghaiensis]MCP3167313.1 hypothetical protein [Myxococcus qinghaiensis]
MDERKAILDRVLQNESSLGAIIESQDGVSARLARGPLRVVLSIDEFGQVLVDGRPARPAAPVGQGRGPSPEPHSASSERNSGLFGLLERNRPVMFLLGLFLLVGVAAILTPSRSQGIRATQMTRDHEIEASAFLSQSAGPLTRETIRKAPRGNSAWAKYAAASHPGIEIEVQARWEGPEFDRMISAADGAPDEVAGRRVYMSGPNVYDQFKIRWADNGWQFYVRATYQNDAQRAGAESVARSVAADIITRGSRLKTFMD